MILNEGGPNPRLDSWVMMDDLSDFLLSMSLLYYKIFCIMDINLSTQATWEARKMVSVQGSMQRNA